MTDLSKMTQDKLHAHNAKAFVVTCMDFRLLKDAEKHLIQRGYDVNYDQFVLAGVSLGYLQKTYSDWGKALVEHINISHSLHHIKEIILIDHLDCGAYKTFLPDLKKEDEYREHVKNLFEAEVALKKEFKNLIIKKWILHLEGDLDEIE